MQFSVKEQRRKMRQTGGGAPVKMTELDEKLIKLMGEENPILNEISSALENNMGSLTQVVYSCELNNFLFNYLYLYIRVLHHHIAT